MGRARATAAALLTGALIFTACAGSPARARRDGGATAQASADACSGASCAPQAADAIDAPMGHIDGPAPVDAPQSTLDAAAPRPDGGAPEPVEGGAPGCAGLFCEDFESGALDLAKWTATSGVNHVDDATAPSIVQSERAGHGRYAAHFHGKGNVSNDDAFIVTKELPAGLRLHNFGRLYFYVSTKPTSGHTMWVLGGSAGMSANPKLRDFEVATIGGGWQLGFDQLGQSPSGEEVFYPTGQVPVGAWTCLEWELDDGPDSDTLWIDGKSLGALDDRHVDYPPGHVAGAALFDGKSTGLVGGFTTYSFGFYDWHPSVDFDLYLDDIVLDTKRVGCL